MDDSIQATPSEERRRGMKARVFGILAIFAGIVGLTCTVVGYHVLQEREPRSQSKISVEIWRFKFVRESRSPPEEREVPWLTPERLRWCGIGIGTAAFFLSALSWIRREGFWLGFTACTFAAAAMAWQVFVTVFGVLLFTGLIFIFVPPGSSQRRLSP
jgi:hypothetical protein